MNIFVGHPMATLLGASIGAVVTIAYLVGAGAPFIGSDAIQIAVGAVIGAVVSAAIAAARSSRKSR